MCKYLSKCLTDRQHLLGILDKNEMKFYFLMNFRNSQFSFFIQWIPIGPGHNSFSLESLIETLAVPPINFVEIRRSNWKIQKVKVVGSLHKPYWKCTHDPLLLLLSVPFLLVHQLLAMSAQ